MLIRQSFDTFIRIWGDMGYIVNKANYSDRLVDKSGSVFLKAVSREPQDFDKVCRNILKEFKNVDIETIRKDALEFYGVLADDGFVLMGDSIEELDREEKRFSYKDIKPRTLVKDFTPAIKRAEDETQVKLDDAFKNEPQLVNFQIELTSRCSERCVHCYIPHENKTNDMEGVLFYSVLNQLKDLNALTLTFSGGEPMVHPKFMEYLRAAKEYDFAINVLSNLTLLDDETIRELKSARLTSLQVSLYSMTPEVHDSITCLKGSFEKTKNAILKCVENDIPLQISAPCMKENKDTLMNVFDWGEKLKVRVVTDYNIMAKYDHDDKNLDHRLTPEESADVIRWMLDHDLDYQQMLLKSDYFVDFTPRPYCYDEPVCGAGMNSACMVANGNVYPCAGWQSYVCGNLKNDTLENIWKNSKEMNFIRGIRKKDFPKCASCQDRKFCHPCMARISNENKDGSPFRLVPHFCQSAHINRLVVEDWIRGLKEKRRAGKV